MRTIILKFIRKPFIKNVIVLTTGTAAAQMLAFVLAPIITRLYGPEAYGMMGTFLAIASIFVPISALAYPIAIVLPKENEDAKALIRLSIWVSLSISFLTSLLLLLFYEPIVLIFGLDEVSSYLFLIPLVIFTTGLLQTIEQWLIRYEQFKVSAKAMFSQSLVMYGGQATLGFLYPIAPVLIIFASLKQSLRTFFMYIYSRNLRVSKRKSVLRDKTSVRKVAKKYRDFPIYRAPELALSTLTSNSPVLMLTAFFGSASAGFYTITRMALSVPTQLLGKSVGDVFYPRINNAANNNEDITELIKKATLLLAVIGVIPYLAVIIFGPWLFGLFFGEEWIRAGEYARWIAIGNFFRFINQPSVRSLPVLSAQAFHLRYAIILLVIQFTMLLIGYYIFSSDIVSIALFGIAGAILNMVLISITLHKSKSFKVRR